MQSQLLNAFQNLRRFVAAAGSFQRLGITGQHVGVAGHPLVDIFEGLNGLFKTLALSIGAGQKMPGVQR